MLKDLIHRDIETQYKKIEKLITDRQRSKDKETEINETY
jgi:hypothetical protein